MSRRGAILFLGILVTVFLFFLLITLTSPQNPPPSTNFPTQAVGATAAPSVSGPTSQTKPTLTLQEQAQQQFSQLRSGESLFNPPKEMQVGVAQTVTYRVLYGANVLPATMQANLPTEDRQVLTGTLRVAPRMTAALVGDGDAFVITAIHSSDEKSLFPNVPNDWSWQVIPTRRGEHKLTIRATAIIEVGQERFPYDYAVEEKTVIVRVNWDLLISDILNRPWTQLTVAAVLLAITASLYQLLKRRHQSPLTVSSTSTWTHIEAMRVTKIRRLQYLEEQQARAGTSTPPEILMELEDLRRDLADLEKRLADMKEEEVKPPKE
jgi:hypothetical protein